MPKKSAGLLVYRERPGKLELFLIHPGGPFWARKDAGSWSIPKGEFTDEDPLEAAKREFLEETGFELSGNFQPLTPFRQAGGKTVYAWAVEADVDAEAVKSNLFSIEWPKGSGKMREFPEVDRAGWFSFEEAKRKILKSQISCIEELQKRVSARQ
jgi:predicted NUDIX family NTP pyrophosphohydrolase